MRYDPAMSRYVRERLKTADLSHGIALDGYPATLVQAEDLSKMVPDLNLKPIAFQLPVSDDIIRERAKKTGRQSDNSQILEQRIKDYHREMDAISFYFPMPTSCKWMPTSPRPRCGRRSRQGWTRRESSRCRSKTLCHPRRRLCIRGVRQKLIGRRFFWLAFHLELCFLPHFRAGNQ